MKKLAYIIGPLVIAVGTGVILGPGIRTLLPSLGAYTVPVTFVDGQVLTAAQLNSVNSTAANAFNGHNHAGTDGEAASLAFTAVENTFTAAGDITLNGATSSLEADGTTATDLLLDQGNFDVVIGDGTETTDQTLTIRAGTGDANLNLQLNNASANTWTFKADNSASDILLFDYNSSTKMSLTTGGVCTVEQVESASGDLLLDQNDNNVIIGSGAETSQEELVIRANTGDASIALRVNNSASNQWAMFLDNSASDNLDWAYAGVTKMELETDGDLFIAGGMTTGGNSTTNKIAWELYTGTTAVGAGATTTVDSSAPGTGAPFSFSCAISNGTTTVTSFAITEATIRYNDAIDDLEIIAASPYNNNAYKCIVIYQP